MNEELPQGWVQTALGAVVAAPRSKATPADHPDLPFVGMDHIAANGMQLLGAGRFGDMKSAGGLFSPGDVLYGRMRPYLNKVHVANQQGACSAEFIVLPQNAAIASGYLAYLLHHRKFVNFASAQSSGDRPRVDFESLSSYEFALPPKAEQARIVSKVDELFSDIEEGERALERVQKLVERYRQSVLKAAVTGELTREWREKHKGPLESGDALLQRVLKGRAANGAVTPRHKEPRGPNIANLEPLPKGWVWTSIEQAGAVKLGRQRAPQHHVGDHMRPYLRVANVYEDRLELSDVKEMNFTPLEYETYALQVDDILLNEGQSAELVGRPAMYRGEVPGCCYQKTLLRFRAHAGVSAAFALLVFRYYLHCGRFRRSANITTSIAHLAAERFGPIEFPLPPGQEQREIVEIALTKLSQIDHLELELKARRKAIEVLRQTTLRSAFSGDLVPQDPVDEPASALVERLRDLRAAEQELTRVRAGRSKTQPLAQVMKAHGIQPQAQRRTRAPRGV